MSDIETLLEWAHALSQGGATVTIEGFGHRYVIPHACVRVEFAYNHEVDEEATARTGVHTVRALPGYRVTFSGETRCKGGDDAVTREAVDGTDTR